MKTKKQNYITFSTEGRLVNEEEAAEVATPPARESAESSDVAYRLRRVAQEAAVREASPNAVDASNVTEYLEKQIDSAPTPEEDEREESVRPRVLVMARGKLARQLIAEAKDAGFSAWAPPSRRRADAARRPSSWRARRCPSPRSMSSSPAPTAAACACSGR